MADTAVTAQTIIDNCVARKKDVDKTTWGDTELLAYLNKAIDNIGMMLIYLESELAITEVTLTLVAGTGEYTLAGALDDFWAMAREGVYFITVETPLTPVLYGTKIRDKSTATNEYPTEYYLTSTKIGVVGVPSATAVALGSGEGANLHCRYFKKPTTLALASDMPYKNVFNEPASLFVDSIAMLRDELGIEAYQSARVALESLVVKVVRYRNPIGPKALSEKG